MSELELLGTSQAIKFLKASGVEISDRQLRRLSSNGNVPSVKNDDNGYRRYRKEDLIRIGNTTSASLKSRKRVLLSCSGTSLEFSGNQIDQIYSILGASAPLDLNTASGIGMIQELRIRLSDLPSTTTLIIPGEFMSDFFSMSLIVAFCAENNLLLVIAPVLSQTFNLS